MEKPVSAKVEAIVRSTWELRKIRGHLGDLLPLRHFFNYIGKHDFSHWFRVRSIVQKNFLASLFTKDYQHSRPFIEIIPSRVLFSTISQSSNYNNPFFSEGHLLLQKVLNMKYTPFPNLIELILKEEEIRRYERFLHRQSTC